MFGWDFQNSKSDRIKLFLFLLSVFLIIGFCASFLFRSIGNEAGQSIGAKTEEGVAVLKDSDIAADENPKETNDYDQSEHFTEKQLRETKEFAVDFVRSYHPYQADEPTLYLEASRSYMTDSLYEKHKQDGRRETLERAILTVDDIQVTEVVNSSTTVARWNVMVMGEAKSIDGEVSETEDWYLIGVREVEGEWKIEDVRVNVPN